MKIVGIQLVSLVSSFQYESNDTNYVQYNQNFVAQLFQSKLILKCVCTLFIETEVVCAKKIKNDNFMQAKEINRNKSKYLQLA
jgi:hypothetical protein